MWDWRKLFGITPRQCRRDAFEEAFLRQAQAQTQTLADLMKGQQDLLRQQQETLDRIVTARYDRPIAVAAQQTVSDPMPDWALNDQGDVRPSEIEAGIRAIAVDSDEEFLSAVGAMK